VLVFRNALLVLILWLHDSLVSTGDAKSFFCRAANGVFGKIGRIASNEVVLQLIKIMTLKHTF